MAPVPTASPNIASVHLYKRIPVHTRLYAIPFLSLYPAFLFTYLFHYDTVYKSEEWTFLACVLLFGGHALSFLVTRWSILARAWVTCREARTMEEADCVLVLPVLHRGQGEIVDLVLRNPMDPLSYTFKYEQDTYILVSSDPPTFGPLPFPSSSKPALATLSTKHIKGLRSNALPALKELYGPNTFVIPIPSFTTLFGEHATAPFFVFQIFCVALWCLDEYWYYSIFTLFMLVVFECTVVYQRVRTLTEFRTMSVEPYLIPVLRDSKWTDIMSDQLVPGDVVKIITTPKSGSASATAQTSNNQETQVQQSNPHAPTQLTLPADILVLRGTAIVNEAMLSGESTPLLKESVQLRDKNERLDVDGAHKGCVLFGGTGLVKVGDTSSPDSTTDSPIDSPADSDNEIELTKPENNDGTVGLVLRTGFGTAQGQLVRTMIFSTERVSANNWESFLFIGFLLIFAIAASAYVWIKGIERDLKKSKLLLDCIMIVTSVVPPELPMELSLAVNASLVALQKYAIFCTEPFRIPLAGRVDVCCFDKTGTITAERLDVEGIVLIEKDNTQVRDIKQVPVETHWCLAAAHALVRLDDGTVAGDPMERGALEGISWVLGRGDMVFPAPPVDKDAKPEKDKASANGAATLQAVLQGQTHIHIRRRFQFSSALKRMSTVSTMFTPAKTGKGVSTSTLYAVKGAPETLKGMIKNLPEGYDETYKKYTRQGSRVLALGIRVLPTQFSADKVKHLLRNEVEQDLDFAGFIVFRCPLKSDAIEVMRGLSESSHRCVMITGDNALTACHVAGEVGIFEEGEEVGVIDVWGEEGEKGKLQWRTVDESKVVDIKLDEKNWGLDEDMEICVTGAAMKIMEDRGEEMLQKLVQRAWVYARVSPLQKETILTTMKSLGFITLMAGDGTNDVGALKQAHVGVALLEGTEEDLKKIANRERVERVKKVYETQVKLCERWNKEPPPVPEVLRGVYPGLEKEIESLREQIRQRARATGRGGGGGLDKFDMNSITNQMADMDGVDEVPKIKLGDASCAAPFTSKLSNVSAISNIIRQGRCTLVATVQMYKILALNCLISAYALSVQYLDGIKYGDYQVTITGMLMSVCFLCISRAKSVEKLSRERPLGNIFNFYVLLSVLIQFAIHIVSMVYITQLSNANEERGPIDLEAKFAPNLLNTAIYLLGLSQQVSTFAINFQGRPFREGIRENPALYWGLVGASAVAFSGATDFVPELNRWLQIVEMSSMFKYRLSAAMVADFAGCWLVEVICKALFANLEPNPIVTRGREKREKVWKARAEREKREFDEKKEQ